VMLIGVRASCAKQAAKLQHRACIANDETTKVLNCAMTRLGTFLPIVVTTRGDRLCRNRPFIK
ncbi:hypothetical protein, partial [Novosphingobium umbonatum]|uniref:hypothetical protein n=1 Tax=Novosphingobium umbonatum TaxID=1908524 RepID=UPI001C700075